MKITDRSAGSVSMILSDDFNDEDFDKMNKVFAIGWTFDVIQFDYEQLLPALCCPPNLKELVLDIRGLRRFGEYFLEIDEIKEVLNKKGIHLTVIFEFVSTSFPCITNDINHVTIKMGDHELDDDVAELNPLYAKIELSNNRLLEIKGMIVYDYIIMDFVNVDQVKFERVRYDVNEWGINYQTVDRPIQMMISQDDGLEGHYDGVYGRYRPVRRIN
jgi:hypothetical protein